MAQGDEIAAGGDADPGVRQPFLVDSPPSFGDAANGHVAALAGVAAPILRRSVIRHDRSEWTPLLIIAGFVAMVGASMPVGYNIGVVNTPGPIIRQFCNESVLAHYGIEISENSLELLWASIVSIFIIGGVTGALISGILADKFGRKGVLIMNNVLGVISAVLFVTCRYANSVEMLFLGRLLIGFSSGLATSVCPMYLTEIAPLRLRGTMGNICPLGIVIGVVFGQFASLNWLLGTEETWHYLLGVFGALILSTALLMPMLPESPKFLFVVQGDETKAVQELCRLRKVPEEDLTDEIFALRQATKSEEQSNGNWTISSFLKSKELRLPLILVCVLQMGQQIVGINAVFYYSGTIFKNAGLSEKTAQYANFGAGLMNLFVTIISFPLINFFGRRSITLVSVIAAGVWLVGLGITIYTTHLAPWVAYLAVLAVYGFVFFFGIGFGCVPYFIGAEVFDVGPRPIGMAFGSAANWAGNFLVGMTFPIMLSVIGASCFFLYAFFAFAAFIFLIFYFPETKGTNPSDIAEMLKYGFKSKIHGGQAASRPMYGEEAMSR